jgi:hypothetical protein
MQAPCPSPVFKPSPKDPDRPNACMFTAFQGNSLSVRPPSSISLLPLDGFLRMCLRMLLNR